MKTKPFLTKSLILIGLILYYAPLDRLVDASLPPPPDAPQMKVPPTLPPPAVPVNLPL